MITAFFRTSSEKRLAARNPVSILGILDVLFVYLVVELFEVAWPFIILIIALDHKVMSAGLTMAIPEDAPFIAFLLLISLLLLIIDQESLR